VDESLTIFLEFLEFIVMVIKIDPCIDFAFKWLFGREENLPLLVDLLNAVLQPATDSGITGLELLNPFSGQDSPEDKLSIVDVKARDSSGRQFDVEMQLLRDRSFCKRVLYYWAGLHLQQLGTGEPYSCVNPTVSVCFTNFVMFEGFGDYYQVFELRNRQGKLLFSSDIMLITLELPKFVLEAPELATPLDCWLYFLRKAERLDPGTLQTLLNRPQIRMAMEALEMLSQDDLERERYLARVRVLRDEKSRLHSAREEGLELGQEQGLEQGRQAGILLGKQSSLATVLEKRFGSVDSRLLERIRALDLRRLEELFDRVIDSGSLAEVEDWLAESGA
jgi:predicted transposase/invertase (TIGR01784 family)